MTIARVALYCGVGGVCVGAMARGQHLALSFLSGVVLAASLAPIARWGPRSFLGQFAAIIAPLWIAGVLCTILEALVFLPGARTSALHDLTLRTFSNLILAAVLAMLAIAMKLPAPAAPDFPSLRRPFVVAGLVPLCGFLYLIYFFVFGSITFIFVKKYYSSQVLQPGRWFLPYEWARGMLMTLALLPIIRSLRLPRVPAALSVGVLLWIVGGGAALLIPNPYMVAPQRYIHIVEILAENVLLGVTSLLLLRPPPRQTDHVIFSVGAAA